MEAHKVKYGTKVIVTDNDIQIPPSSPQVNKGDEITILHLDGIYCNGRDKEGNRIYIGALTQVEPC